VTRLKLSDVTDEKPIKLTIEIPLRLHRDLIDYGVVLNGGDERGAPEPDKLIAPMIQRFIATDREFAKVRRSVQPVQEKG